MYEKNLTEDFRLRLSKTDMDFLREISDDRQVSVSEVVRSILGEYRRSVETIKMMNNALEVSRLVSQKGAVMSNGDTKNNINDKL